MKERVAHNSDIRYISMQGNIGCMANGAGLCMATNDILNQFGGYPANFMDLGGPNEID